MRAELERTEKIERFLLGLFTKVEENQFKQQLITDSDLVLELEWQRLLMKRIEKIAIKQEISFAHKKYMQRFRFSFKNKVFRNWVVGFSSVLVFTLVGVFYFYITDNEAYTTKAKEPLFTSVIDSEIQFSEMQVNVDKPILLNFQTGTFVIIPSDAFVDETNNIVTGEISIKFREFNNRSEKSLENLLKDTSCLEHASMNEFYAFKDGKPLKINTGKEIEIIQLTSTTSSLFNVYQFQTDQHEWREDGKDLCFDLSGQVVDNQLLQSLLESLHIENPKNDPEILKEQNAYIDILKELSSNDSINNDLKNRCLQVKGEEKKEGLLHEIYDLYRQRIILLANTNKEEVKDTLINIGSSLEALENKAGLIRKEYQKFKDKNLIKLRQNLRFCRVYSINKTGLWSISVPVKKGSLSSIEEVRK